MRRTQLATMAVALAGAMTASATIVNFDDLPTPNTVGGVSDWGAVPSSYAGLTWTGWEVTKADGTAGSYQTIYGNTYGASSSPNFAYNGGDGYKTISTGGTTFNFDGAYVTSFVQNNAYQVFSSQNLTINAYHGALLVGTWTGSLSPSSFVALPIAAHFLDITALQFISDGEGRYWGLDDFAFSAVPEPTTMIAGALLLLPFGMSTLRMFRKTRTA
jgi:hypothetical protein